MTVLLTSARRQDGQTMTEFAVVLPVLCLVLFAVAQFGILFNNYVTLTDAVRAGARKAAVSRHLDAPGAEAEVKLRAAAADLRQDDLDVTVESDWGSGDDVVVRATYPYQISLLGLVVQAGDLESETTERVE
jgi:Flp pilus assembly protein TadG